MKRNLSVLMLLVVMGSEASGQASEFAAGRAYYVEGEFKKAVAHFQLALKANPTDAETYYWMGKSYEVLADIAFPFASKYSSKARICLTTAMELAPTRSDYRRELFDFLVDSASRAAMRQAADLMRLVPEPDPDYNYMHRRFNLERRANASVDAQLGGLFLAIPRVTYRLAELPASALSSWRAAGLEPLGSDDGVSAPGGTWTAVAGEW